MCARPLVIVAAGLLWYSLANADCPPCGPTLCTETPQYKKAFADKKKTLSEEYPARIVAILDRVGHCERCVTTAPEGFSLLRKDAQGKITIDAWTAENEKVGARDLSSGKLKACRVIYVRKTCACCNEKPAEERADWSRDLELNTEMSVPCSSE